MTNVLQPVHVDITNVARWFYEDNSQEIFNLGADFPALLSPWETAVYRYPQPRYSNSEGRIIRMPLRGMLTEVTVTTHEIDEERDAASLSHLSDKLGISPISEPRWGQRFEIRLNGRSDILGGCVMMLDEAGAAAYERLLFLVGHKALGSEEDINNFVNAMIFPVAYAISLLHCRNVEVRDRPVSRQQRRLAERRGEPVITYKELVIEAFRKQVRYEAGQSGEGEVQRALHICRGHFATYTDTSPLFGKYTGRFWRPMHTRGHKEAGQVKKGYSVKGQSGDAEATD